MKKVISIVIGSKSDMSTMQEVMSTLQEFNVSYEVLTLSAHRTPKKLAGYLEGLKNRDIRVIIAGAGGAAALAGVIAAHTTLPVIGVPIETKSLKGLDSLLSTVQMPKGVPVACMAIGASGAKNAAIFALEILASGDHNIQRRLERFKKKLAK